MLLEVAGVTVKFTLQQLCIWTVEARWLNLTPAKMEGKFTWRRQCRWRQGGAGGGDTGNRGKPPPGKYLEIFNIQYSGKIWYWRLRQQREATTWKRGWLLRGSQEVQYLMSNAQYWKYDQYDMGWYQSNIQCSISRGNMTLIDTGVIFNIQYQQKCDRWLIPSNIQH